VAAIKFYTDEHVASAVVKGLRERGVEVMTAAEAGLRGASDEVHLAHARAERRVLVSHDADFLRLHAAGTEHPGIAYSPQTLPVGDLIRALMLLVQVLESDDMINHVEFL
jgi:predicted nuclease of predicted toxin-antitoxin system